MKIPILFGFPIHLWLGILLLCLVIFQIVSAKKILDVPFKWHRRIGYVLLVLAIIHGTIAFGLNSGWFFY